MMALQLKTAAANNHYRNRLVCRVPGKDPNALRKGFVECHSRHASHSNQTLSKIEFAECFLLDSRQSLCQMLRWDVCKKNHGNDQLTDDGDASLLSALTGRHSAKIQALPSAMPWAHDKDGMKKRPTHLSCCGGPLVAEKRRVCRSRSSDIRKLNAERSDVQTS